MDAAYAFTNTSGDTLLSHGNVLIVSQGTLQAKRVAGHASALDEAMDRALKGDVAIGISVNTVRSHLQHAYAKTGASDQTALSALVNGLMPPVG